MHGFCDISMLRVFPKTVLMAAMDEPSLRGALEFMRLYDQGISCVRYPRDSVSEMFADTPCPPFELGKARPLCEHEQPDAAILAYGVMAIEAMNAVQLLDSEYRVNIYDARFARPVDTNLLSSLIRREIPIITVEDHGIEGGFGSCVVDACVDLGLDTRLIKRLAIPARWIYQGARTDQLEESGLDAPSIARTVREVVDTASRGRDVPVITIEPRVVQTKSPMR